MNEDGAVNLSDLMIVVNHWGSEVPPSHPQVDLDCDGNVTVIDLQIIANHFGYDVSQECPTCCYEDTYTGYNWDPPVECCIDLNEDGVIDIIDIQIVADQEYRCASSITRSGLRLQRKD